MPLNLHAAEKPPGSMRVTLEGRLDADTTRQLEALLEPLLRTGFREIRFDLTGLHYISSMGLRVFLKTAKTLRGSATKLVLTGMQPTDPPNLKKAVMPIVWLQDYHTSGGATSKILASTIGAATDLRSEDLRRLFVNASYFLTGLDVPKLADVTPVGTFEPSMFGFRSYKKGVKVESHELR